MEKTDEQLASLIEKLQEAGFAQVPEVFDGTIRAIYLDGVLQVSVTTVLAVFFVMSIVLTTLGLAKDEEEVAVCGVACSAFTLFLTVMFGVIGNPWAKVFDPEAVFYYEIFSKIL